MTTSQSVMPNSSSTGTRHRMAAHSVSSISSIISGSNGVLPSDAPGASIEETAAEMDDLAEIQGNPTHTRLNEEASQPPVDCEDATRRQMPWWKKPAPWWLLILAPLGNLVLAATVAPRLEIYTLLACRQHKPEIFDKLSAYARILPNQLEYAESDSGFGSSFNHLIQNTSGTYATAIFSETAEERPGRNPCSSDPTVQAAVTKFATVTSITSGTLSFLTGGWWGSFSDRHGRRKMLAISAIGALFGTLNFIFVMKNYEQIPGGYWFLILDSLVAGVLGGTSSDAAAQYAYTGDVSTPEERSRNFSVLAGLVVAGIALGPTIGGVLVRFSGNVLSVIYLAAAVHATILCFAWFILPESLTGTQMHTAAIQHEENLRLLAIQKPTPLLAIKRSFAFLEPLTILLPRPVERDSSGSHLGRKRDWNLTLLALSYGIVLTITGALMTLFQYATATFGWDTASLGYFITVVGATRAIYLTLLLPLVINLLKAIATRKTIHRSLESVPLLSERTTSPSSHSIIIDLSLARLSLLIDVVSYIFLPFSPSGIIFTSFMAFGSLGSGFVPAVRSIALDIVTRRNGGDGVESGKLFGALGVVQAACAEVLGPAIYGFIYYNTVATFPAAIFFVVVGSAAVSFALLGLVRLSVDTKRDVEDVSTVDTPRQL
ncbi:major facilitator superfamily domain-containing protein [Mycena rebaudengoi]|nr:major facilitator superfamily domain-containing protein [Mycena rebaudengoi]